MTDQILIECLRLQAEQQNLIAKTAMQTAANSIEELVKENYQLTLSLEMCHGAWDQALDERNEAEAKLAKAVEALRFYSPETIDGIEFDGGDDAGQRAESVLVELGVIK